MKGRRKSQYRGILAKPLPPSDDPTYQREFTLRMLALYGWYEVTLPNFIQLMSKVLAHHIPGFRPTPQISATEVGGASSLARTLYEALHDKGQRAKGRPRMIYDLILPNAEKFLKDRKANKTKLGDVALCRRFLRHEKDQLKRAQSLGLFEGVSLEFYDDFSPHTLSRKLRERRQKQNAT